MAIEIVFEKRINNVAVHGDVDGEQRREHILVTCLAALFVVGLLFYGWQQYSWIASGFDIGTAQKMRDELAEVRKQLQVERDSLARPERIDAIARKQLGMMVPAPGQRMPLIDSPLDIPAGKTAEPAALTASQR